MEGLPAIAGAVPANRLTSRRNNDSSATGVILRNLKTVCSFFIIPPLG